MTDNVDRAAKEERTVGTLTADDIYKAARIEFEGWVHVGTLRSVQHEASWREGQPPRCQIGIRYESGASWFKTIDTDTPIELREKEKP